MTALIKRPIFFVSGTDTGVGKTLICGLLLRYLKDRGVNCGYQKWVATGGSGMAADLLRVGELSGRSPNHQAMRVEHLFPHPASPHLAAAMAGEKIDPGALIRASLRMAASLECLIIEGTGGLMVPLTRDTLIIDLMAKLNAPVLLVAKSGLGTINHTLLAAAALKARDINCAGLIFSDENPDLDEQIVADNLKTIAETGKAVITGRLRRRGSDAELIKEFEPMGRTITTAMDLGK